VDQAHEQIADAVEQRLAKAGVGEDRRPLRERQVDGDNDGGLLFSVCDDLEEHLGSDFHQRNVAHLVEGNQGPVLPSSESAVELAGLAGFDEFVDKVRLAASQNAILTERLLIQAEAARLLGVNQPKVSALKGYKLEGFSVERLVHFATVLECDVVSRFVWTPQPRARDWYGGSGGVGAMAG
jgi:predicted XRE-type DNA-binding protein